MLQVQPYIETISAAHIVADCFGAYLSRMLGVCRDSAGNRQSREAIAKKKKCIDSNPSYMAGFYVYISYTVYKFL